MKTLITALTAAAALGAVAAPAAAQSYRDGRGFDGLEARLELAQDRGAIAPGKAYQVRRLLNQAEGFERMFLRDGRLTSIERRDLDNRYYAISTMIPQVDRYADRGRWNDRYNDRYDDRYHGGYDGGYDRGDWRR